MSLVGKVVGISWQDIWWAADERKASHPWEDEEFIHFTYGLVLRDDKQFISLTHEWRPQRGTHMSTTSIPKKVIRSVKVYGDGSIETEGQEGNGDGAAPAGGRKKSKRAARRASAE